MGATEENAGGVGGEDPIAEGDLTGLWTSTMQSTRRALLEGWARAILGGEDEEGTSPDPMHWLLRDAPWVTALNLDALRTCMKAIQEGRYHDVMRDTATTTGAATDMERIRAAREIVECLLHVGYDPVLPPPARAPPGLTPESREVWRMVMVATLLDLISGCASSELRWSLFPACQGIIRFIARSMKGTYERMGQDGSSAITRYLVAVHRVARHLPCVTPRPLSSP